MVYLLYGEDTFLINSYIKKLKREFGEIQNGINYIQMDESSIQNLIPEIQTPAFGYPTKMILIRNSNIFIKKCETAEKIANYLKEHQIENVEIIFTEKNVEKNALYNVIAKKYKCIEFNELNSVQLIDKITMISNLYNVKIEKSNAQYLVECVGQNLQDITIELQKLIEYAGKGGTIEKNDIDQLVIKKSENVIFDLTDNIGKRDVKNAIDVLHNLEYSKEPDQLILIMLYRHIKKLYIAKISNQSNITQNLNLKPNQAFLVKKYLNQARYFKEDEIEKILFELIGLDEKSKSGDIDLKVGLETIIANYCSK